MTDRVEITYQGGCGCGRIRYRLRRAPLYVHCCHCHWCQRESGSAFALNAIIESHEVEVLKQSPVLIDLPTASGRGQQMARCSECQLALWSHYSGLGKQLSFIRVGTLDQPNQIKPDIHIYLESKQDWFQVPDAMPSYQRYYDRKTMWPKSSLQRLNQLLNQNK